MAVNTLIQIRRGTSAEWAASNGNLGAVLAAGELGLDTTLDRIKIGDGSTAWNSLEFVAMSYTDILTGSGVAITQLTDSNSQVTGLSISTNLVAGSNITLTESAGAITINGEAGITLSEGTGIHIVTDGSDKQINVTYTNQEFLDAVDNRITEAAISSEKVMDIVGTGVLGVSGVGINYKDADNRLEFGLVNDSITVGSTEIALGASATTITGLTSVTSTSFVGDLTGNADTATEATNVTASANNSTDETVYLTFVDGTTGTQGIETDTGLTFNPSSDTLTVSTVDGDVTGNAGTADQVKTQQSSTNANHYIAFVDSDNGSATAETVYTNAGLTYNPSSNNFNIGNDLIVGGNLTVQGTTTTVNSTTVDIGDNIIQVNVSGAEILGGIAILDHDSSETFQIVYDNVDTRFEFMSDGGTAPDVFTSGDLSANILTSTVSEGTAPLSVTSTTVVTNLNADLLDGEHGSYYVNWDNTSNKPSPIITGILTGAVSGDATVTLAELADGTLSISATLASNIVESSNIVNGAILDDDINASANINVAKLSASGVTIGSTTINLGNTSTVLEEMTAIGGVSGTPMAITYATIDGGSP